MIETAVLILTAVVAVYGAGLSTWVFLDQRRRARPQIEIVISQGFLPRGREIGASMLIMTVTNPGHRTATVQSPGLLLPSGQQVVFFHPNSEVTFPHELLEGKACHSWTPLVELASQIREHGLSGTVQLVAVVSDAVGNEYRSEESPLDVDYWASQPVGA